MESYNGFETSFQVALLTLPLISNSKMYRTINILFPFQRSKIVRMCDRRIIEDRMVERPTVNS